LCTSASLNWTFSDKNQCEYADGTPKSEAYTSEENLFKVTQEQLAASAAGPQAQESSPQDQQEGFCILICMFAICPHATSPFNLMQCEL